MVEKKRFVTQIFMLGIKKKKNHEKLNQGRPNRF